MHYNEYLLEIHLNCQSSRNVLWNDEELVLLALAQIRAEANKNIKFINLHLQKLFAHRSSNEINCIRK